jgi:hypothetical protein
LKAGGHGAFSIVDVKRMRDPADQWFANVDLQNFEVVE